MNYDLRVAQQVGGALLRIRRERRVQQREVARLAGIRPAMLSSYENGRQCPSLANLVNLLRVLGCSADEFGSYLGPWGRV
jgi:transcriptional regulator with XRE-family HTH domain